MKKDDLKIEYSTTHPKTGEIVTSEDPAEIIGLRLQHILNGGKPSNELLFDMFRKSVENLRPSLDMVSLAHITMMGHWQNKSTPTPLSTTREMSDLYTPIGKILKLIEDIEEILHEAQQQKMF